LGDNADQVIFELVQRGKAVEGEKKDEDKKKVRERLERFEGQAESAATEQTAPAAAPVPAEVGEAKPPTA
jgi:hypothetical protein